MIQKAYVHIEVSKESRNYSFQMPFGCSYQECYDVAIEIANKIIELSKQAQETEEKLKAENEASNQESAAEKEASSEEPVVEEKSE